MNSTIVSLQRVGVPMRVIQHALLHSGPDGLESALALHPSDEYQHIRYLRAHFGEMKKLPPLPEPRKLIRVRMADPIYSKNCRG